MWKWLMTYIYWSHLMPNNWLEHFLLSKTSVSLKWGCLVVSGKARIFATHETQGLLLTRIPSFVHSGGLLFQNLCWLLPSTNSSTEWQRAGASTTSQLLVASVWHAEHQRLQSLFTLLISEQTHTCTTPLAAGNLLEHKAMFTCCV